MKTKILLLMVTLVFLLIGCEKEEPYVDPCIENPGLEECQDDPIDNEELLCDLVETLCFEEVEELLNSLTMEEKEEPYVDPCIENPDLEECQDDPKDNEELLCDLVETLCFEEVEELLNSLTMEEKAAQMIQAERGSISPAQLKEYGIGSILSGGGSHPSRFDNSADEWYDMYENYQDAALESSSGIPIIYGIDAVHGNNNLYGATIFPHNVGLGAANDANLMYRIGQATAEEMKVTGITWTFAPAVSVVQDISWGRTYEGFSENPAIHLNLTEQFILGLQQYGVSATAKHYLADGGTFGGVDQGNTVGDSEDIRAIHLAPYVEAIEANVDTIMISYSSINGIKMHGSHYWITEVLKEELGFEGFIISDWNAIHQLPGDFNQQVITSVNAGVDMLMEPYDWAAAYEAIVNGVNNNHITEERLEDAVRRILNVKHMRGLLEDPYDRLDPDTYLYSQENQDLAREAVQKSLVLLKNEGNVLPLSKNETIYITGPGADHIGYLCGGWTTYWQGNTDDSLAVGTSILDAFDGVLGANGGNLTLNWQNADTVVVVLTETPYSEGAGDNDVLTLIGGNAHPDNVQALEIARQAHLAGKDVVGILVSGRPLLLGNYEAYFDSFVAAWLPGTEGGLGIADVLFGDVNFSGKLAFTWPADITQIGYTSNREDYDESSVLYPYGYGLTY